MRGLTLDWELTLSENDKLHKQISQREDDKVQIVNELQSRLNVYEREI